MTLPSFALLVNPEWFYLPGASLSKLSIKQVFIYVTNHVSKTQCREACFLIVNYCYCYLSWIVI